MTGWVTSITLPRKVLLRPECAHVVNSFAGKEELVHFLLAQDPFKRIFGRKIDYDKWEDRIKKREKATKKRRGDIPSTIPLIVHERE